jgi:hypothetical protein
MSCWQQRFISIMVRVHYGGQLLRNEQRHESEQKKRLGQAKSNATPVLMWAFALMAPV